MAQLTRRLSGVANGVWILSSVGNIGGLGVDECRLSRGGTRVGRASGRPQFRHHRSLVRATGKKKGEEIGVDGYKKVKGRKRTAVVDVLGLILKCHVGAANQADVKAAPWVLFWVLERRDERLAKILADPGDEGDLEDDIEAVYGAVFEVVQHEGNGFSVQPKRWIVERTWAWLENGRALTRDYERLPENHEEMVHVAMIRLMLRRLENNRRRWKKEAA